MKLIYIKHLFRSAILNWVRDRQCTDQLEECLLRFQAASDCTESYKIQIDFVGSSSLSKQRLPHRGNITAVVFPKWLKLSVINHAHSALTSFGIRLVYGSSLKSQKPCQGFAETLLEFQCLLRLPFRASSEAISVILAGLLCFSLLLSCVYIFILEFFVAVRL